MTTNNSINEVPLEGGFGFGDAEGVSNCIVVPNQDSQLVSHHVGSSQEIVLYSPEANVNSVGLESGFVGVNSVGLSGIEGGREDGSASSSNPIKKSSTSYSPRQLTRGVKKRLIWTPELHEHFLEIYNSSPDEKPVPKKILEKMRERFSFITRENVASHLQKHRLLEKKLKNKEMGSSSSKASSSKSPPLKVAKKSNLQPNPNSQQIPHQPSHSTCPNSQQIHFQSHSIPTTSNSHLIIPQQNHHIQHPTLQNNQLSNFHETHLLDQEMMPSFNNNVHGGAITNIYSNSNMINVCDQSQDSPNWAPPPPPGIFGPSSSSNPYPLPISTHQMFNNVDAYGNANYGNGSGNGNDGFNPMSMANSYGGLNYSNDYCNGGALQNFAIGADHNMNFDHNGHLQINDCFKQLCALQKFSEDLESGSDMNEFKSDYQQALGLWIRPNGHLGDVSTLPQTLESQQLYQYLVQQRDVNPANPCVEQLSNFTTTMNEASSSNGNHGHLRMNGGSGSSFLAMNETFSSKVNHGHSRTNGNGSN